MTDVVEIFRVSAVPPRSLKAILKPPIFHHILLWAAQVPV